MSRTVDLWMVESKDRDYSPSWEFTYAVFESQESAEEYKALLETKARFRGWNMEYRVVNAPLFQSADEAMEFGAV